MHRSVKGSIRDCKALNDVSQEEKTKPRRCRISTIEPKNRYLIAWKRLRPGDLRRSQHRAVVKVIHAGGESSRLHDRVLLRAGADPARHRECFGCAPVRACFPYADCGVSRQARGAPGRADSRQRKPAAFVGRQEFSQAFPSFFWGPREAARNGSPMLPRTSV